MMAGLSSGVVVDVGVWLTLDASGIVLYEVVDGVVVLVTVVFMKGNDVVVEVFAKTK